MQVNIQPIEKQEHTNDGSLQIHKIFYTLQGEGPYAGQPAVFVRLAGCNLQCPACDTDYTSSRTFLSVTAIEDYIQELMPFSANYSLFRAQGKAPGLVVITGGEPYRQRLAPLINYLLSRGYRVQIETNGSLYQDLIYSNANLCIVCSPKTGKLASRLIPHIGAYKYVVKTGDVHAQDGLPIHALDHGVSGRVARPPEGYRSDRIYVQPIDVEDPIANNLHLQTAVKSCLKFGYTLCLQMHKIADLD